VPRPEREHLEPVLARLEGAGDAGRDPNRVTLLQLENLIVELEAAGPGDNEVGLLGLRVPVAEALSLTGLEAVVAEPGLLGVDVSVGEAGL